MAKPTPSKPPRSTPPKKILAKRTRRLIALIFVLSLAALLTAQRLNLLPGPDPSDHRRYDNKTFTVVRIVDGDTLDINIPDGTTPTTRIRLWGVDTPETRHPQRGQMVYGPEATAFTKKLTLNKKVKVVLEPFENTRGKYGRLLAYLYLPDQTMLNEALLTGGYAYADERFSHMYRQKFIDLQKQAQREKQGLWKITQPHHWPDWYQKRHDPEYHKNQ